MMTGSPALDVVIVGGGPAGLSAALVLARCRRRVVVIDAGHPRNYASRGIHNLLTRDGIDPMELLRLGRAEVTALGVEFRQGLVKKAFREEAGFCVELASGERLCSRALLLATGVLDELPSVKNLESFYGLGVHHCPYCDAYEYADQSIAAYGHGRPALGLAQNLLTWSPAVTALTDGHALSSEERELAAALGIAVREEPLERLEAAAGRDGHGVRQFREPRQAVAVDGERGKPDHLGRIVFQAGPPLEVQAMFFNTAQFQRSQLPFDLGCRKDADGGVLHDDRQRTGIPGLYLAGDASKDVQFVVVAAAEGARAGVAINGDLQAESMERRKAAMSPPGRRPIHPLHRRGG